MISCRARLVTKDETWLYHYNPETKQQSMEWRHSGSPRPPKNSECKNPLDNFSPRFFGIKTASSSLIIFRRAKLSTRSMTHLCWCNWRTFWSKNAAGSSPTGSCSCTTMPRLTGHLQPRRNWPPTLFSGSGPVGLPPVPWAEKTIERSQQISLKNDNILLLTGRHISAIFLAIFRPNKEPEFRYIKCAPELWFLIGPEDG